VHDQYPVTEPNAMKFFGHLATILFLLLCTVTGNAQMREVTLQLKWWHQFQFAGYYAAITQGYYSQEGLNVTLIPGDADHPAINEVLSGDAAFGITGSDLLIEYAKGKPLMALGAIFQHSPYVIMSLPGKHINAPSDLVGKTIMASENQGWVELKAIFLKEGIDLKNVSVIGHTWNNMDLIRGRADAMTGYRSVEHYQLQQLGVQPSLILPINYGVDFYGDILFATRSYVEQNPQLVEKFRQASFKGWEYAMSHKEELCDYILKLPGVAKRDVTKAALMYEADEMEKLILPQLIEIGHMNEGRWNHILAIHQGLGLIPSNTKLDRFVYEKKPSIWKSLQNIGAFILGTVFLLFLVVLIYGVMVRRAVKRKTQEQRGALEALSGSEEKYRTLVEQASDGIVICDPEFRFIQANSAALNLLGYSKQELYQLHLPDILSINETDPPLRLKELYQNQSLLSERAAKRKDGSTFIVEIRSTILSNRNYLGFVRDITAKKNAEEQLLKQERQLDLIYNKVADCIFVLSVTGDKHFKFISINNSFLETTGLQEWDVINKSVEEVIPESSRSFVLEKYQEAITQKRTVQWEEETVYPAGKKIGIVSVTPVFENNTCTQLIGSVHDITETKFAQNELETEKETRAAEREMMIYELSNTNKELKQFSFITSHNLRAPLTNLVAITNLIDLTKIHDDETRQLIQGFTTSTQQLNDTLNDLVRILIIKESTNLPVENLSFEEVFQHVKRSIYSIIESAGTIIHMDFSLGPQVLFNRLYLESIFLNLLTNSIKYARPGIVPEIYIRTEIKNGQVQLVFRDTGAGFDMAKVKDRVFGLHQRFHHHPDSKGIGLYLIHAQINSLGGQIEVESEVGKGTTFTIRFKSA
jgi:PAS domain S-box-containing protein